MLGIHGIWKASKVFFFFVFDVMLEDVGRCRKMLEDE